ncbi:MAG TPA: hypothetical protein VH595_04920 [Verrucomicrobiae bacterium]|nr:hypothetical protein [Verrucomicrobiae bacterium]
MAATNLYPYAYLDMSKALEQGVGTSIDLVQSYAWLKLFSETSPGGIYGRVLMNSMALKMGTEEIERAQRLAADFRAGHWQFPNTRVIPDNDSALKLTAITISSAASLAVINGKTLLPGESTIISLKSGKVGLRCLKIDKDFVQVLISGEDEPRVLRLGN